MTRSHEGTIGDSDGAKVDASDWLLSPEEDPRKRRVIHVMTEMGIEYAFRGLPGTNQNDEGQLEHVGFEVNYPKDPHDLSQGNRGRIAALFSPEWRREGGNYPQREAAVRLGGAVIAHGEPLVINDISTSPIVGARLATPADNPSGKPKHQTYDYQQLF